MVPKHQWQGMSAFWMNVESICEPDTQTYRFQKSQRDLEQSGHD